MIIQTKNTDFDELTEKILLGVNKGLRKLVETSAAKGQSLVIGDSNGGFKEVPAKELLEKLQNENF